MDKLLTYLYMDELCQGTVSGAGHVCSGSTVYFHMIQRLILMC